MQFRISAALAVAALVSGCGSYATSSVKPTTGATQQAATTGPKLAAKNPADIILTENDITDKPYTSLGDISVTVRKATIFDKDPNQESVGQALKEKAAGMGADAVVLARYGTVGIGFTSWGVMDGNGRAVVFNAK
jgi:uncharacterized protein YceK